MRPVDWFWALISVIFAYFTVYSLLFAIKFPEYINISFYALLVLALGTAAFFTCPFVHRSKIFRKLIKE